MYINERYAIRWLLSYSRFSPDGFHPAHFGNMWYVYVCVCWSAAEGWVGLEPKSWKKPDMMGFLTDQRSLAFLPFKTTVPVPRIWRNKSTKPTNQRSSVKSPGWLVSIEVRFYYWVYSHESLALNEYQPASTASVAAFRGTALAVPSPLWSPDVGRESWE